MTTARRLPDVLQKEWTLPPSTLERYCVHCRKPYTAGESASPFCKQSCKTLNNRAKWKAAPAAVMSRLGEWTTALPPMAKVDELFEWFVDSRYPDRRKVRARLMTDVLGLAWNAGVRAWQTK